MAFEFETKPKFATFDMNGTLIQFRINDAIREVLGDRLPAEIADDYLQACKAYRIDECMGDYKPFHQIVADSMERASREARPRVPCGRRTGGLRDRPHVGSVPGGDRGAEPSGRGGPAGHHHQQRHRPRCAPLGEPPGPVRGRHQRRAEGVYKPRLAAFEYMFAKLGVTPDEIVHVSASPMYDLRPAAVMGIKNKVYVDRGFEHDEHWLGYERITDIADLPVLFGLPRPAAS